MPVPGPDGRYVHAGVALFNGIGEPENAAVDHLGGKLALPILDALRPLRILRTRLAGERRVELLGVAVGRRVDDDDREGGEGGG